MSVVRHPKSPYWYVRFTAPDGRRVFQSTRTTERRAAEEYETQLKSRLWREVQLGESQATWREAVVSWLKSTEHRDRAKVQAKLRWLDRHLGHRQLREITTDALYRVREARAGEGSGQATINRYMAVVSAVLHHAKERGWLPAVPTIPRTKEKRRPPRWLTQEEARRLLERLRATAPHLADMAEFSLATGLRESNVAGLRWDWVDTEKRLGWIPPEQSKSGRTIRVPLNDIALEVLERRQGEHDVWVFTYRGRRVARCNNTAFRKAVAAERLHRVNWHTWRHTWASWHAMAGTPLQVLMELGGWTSMRMVLRYAHLAPDHLSEFAGNAVIGWGSGGNGVTP